MDKKSMYQSMNEIIAGLWLGGIRSALDAATLREKNIDHIVSVCDCNPLLEEKPGSQPFPIGDFKQHFVKAFDDTDQDLITHFEDCFQFIQKGMESGGGVLVHCQMGVSRSATIVIGYLMRSQGLTLDSACKKVFSARPVVSTISDMAKTIANKQIVLVLGLPLFLFLLLNVAPMTASYQYMDEDDLIRRTPRSIDSRVYTIDRTVKGIEMPPYPDEQTQMQDTINEIRSAASPPSSDMRYMTLNSQFSDEAKNLALNCNGAEPHPGVLFVSTERMIFYSEALKMIKDEGEAAIKNGDDCNRHPWMCRYYRKLMDAGSDSIGCARVYCSGHFEAYSWWYVYCVTNAKSSNEPSNSLSYKTGKPCQMCPKSSGYCYNNLCVSHATKTDILAKTPSSVITCDAPCMNCGERKDEGNMCFCQCLKGYSEADCSQGSVSLACSACKAGTPCRNGGRKAGGPSEPCSCQCNGEYAGDFCEIPMAQVIGGMVVDVQLKDGGSLDGIIVDQLAEELKRKMTDEINKFCRASQTNYVQCCGSGILPTTGSLDFLDANSVHVARPVQIGSQNRASATVYATAKGNNGLCRKRTAIPTPNVAVPHNVVKAVLDSKISGLTINCCNATVTTRDTYRNVNRLGMPKMNGLTLKVG